MMAGDPLRTVELLALLEEATTPLRHDVRNRIASIRNLSFFVRRKLTAEVAPDRDPRVNDFLLKIESEVQRTDELIDAWATRVQERRERATVRANVQDCLRLAMDSARLPSSVGFELSFSSDESLELDADRDTLAFAVRCLLENAGEAMGTGLVRLRVERSAEECQVVVSDSGPGIADAARCVERFETTKPGHLGLGLCMARRIAGKLGGDLLIGSPESGAEVSLLLPISGAASAAGAPP
jgi:signal transduction histidine kinase